MDLSKLTDASKDAINSARRIALTNKHAEIKNIHLFSVLLKDGMFFSMDTRSKVSIDKYFIRAKIDKELDKLPKVSGGSSPNGSRELLETIDKAVDFAAKRGDSFATVDDLLEGLFESKDSFILDIINTHPNIKNNLTEAGESDESGKEIMRRLFYHLFRNI